MKRIFKILIVILFILFGTSIGTQAIEIGDILNNTLDTKKEVIEETNVNAIPSKENEVKALTEKTDFEITLEYTGLEINKKKAERDRQIEQKEKEEMIYQMNKSMQEEADRKRYIEEHSIIQYDLNDLSLPSNLCVEKVNQMLAGTRLQRLSQTLVDCEKKYNVNLVFVVGLMAQESGWGTSDRAIYDNNLSGFEVPTDDSAGRSFYSWDECCDVTFSLLSSCYLNPNGCYYRGKSIYAINILYSADSGWAEAISTIMSEFN